MSKIKINELFLYRHRYWIGYGLVSIGLIAVLLFAGLYAPGGLSEQEMKSVVESNALSFKNIIPSNVVNLPFHTIQHIVLNIFGVSIFSIKLPSIILAFISAIGMIFLLRKWIKPNVGILASLIAITTGQFLFIAQSGTHDILYLLWSAWLLLIALLIVDKQKFRKILVMVFFIIMSLSLYTPLSIYVLIAFIGALILHPHLRFLVKQISKLEMAIGIIVSILLLTPLILATIKDPKIALTMMGIPNSWPNWGANIAAIGAEYFGFAKSSSSTFMTPFFELGSMLLIGAGLYDVIKKRAASKSYIILSWLICLTPIIIINPEFTSITFLPLVILLAYGLNLLLVKWYGIFPINPYARAVGLIPLIVLVGVLVYSGADRYIYGYRYDPSIVSNFSRDIELMPPSTKYLIVTGSELDFYKILAIHNNKLQVTTDISSQEITEFTTTNKAKQNYKDFKIDKIITSSSQNNSDRFYIYKKITD